MSLWESATLWPNNDRFLFFFAEPTFLGDERSDTVIIAAYHES